MKKRNKKTYTQTFYQIWKDDECNGYNLMKELDLKVCEENDYNAKSIFKYTVESDIVNAVMYDGEVIYTLEKVTFEFYDDDDYQEIKTEIMNEIKINVE